MAGKNVTNNFTHNLVQEPKKLDLNTKLLFDDKLNRLHEWFNIDSKYSENEIAKYVLENDNIEIRRNRKTVDYLEVLFNPKMFKEYILITQNNFILFDQKEFDKLFDSILFSIPIQIKDKKSENEVNLIKSKINKINGTFNTLQTMISNIIIENEEVNEKSNQLLKETIKKKHLLENMKVVNFLIECINPILVNGILEIMKKMPSDPTDFLVEYIYNHNMYNPCVSSPLNKKSKVANSLNKHLL
ncbi:uncharacterized protein LOC112686796 [Sipha flava]|uniref:Uncharacterized protein LOC112686796 n=1 Tax=Sipha flava TaxID=143950 RepID=A0A8B8FXD8_9HEMI|nr:uncharacterized protein LOC112686796 [Sipha flava]